MQSLPQLSRRPFRGASQTLALPARASRILPAALLLLLAALLATAAPTWAAPEPGSGNELFIERVDINVINVEAFVTDKDGKAVNDLAAEDFEVLEDGKPVEITNFFKNEAEALDSQLARDRGLLAGGRSEAVASPRDVPEDQRQNLVVYVDLYNLRPANRTKVLKQLGGFLEDRIYQGDRIMMVAHQRNLQMIHPFTQDIQRVVKGIERVAKMETGGQMMDAERRRIHNMLFNTTKGSSAGEDPGLDQTNALENIRIFVQQQRLETEGSMQALTTVLRSLGGVPGRRALLYVSDGLEQQPGADLFQTYLELYGTGPRNAGNFAPRNPGIEQSRNDLTKVFDKVAQSANTYQVTLYTLQARGAAAMSSISAENGDVSAGFGGRIAADASRGLAEQEPLISLADQTGGSAILGTSNFGGALESLSNDFNSLYSLGYRSRTGGDGKYHKIEVKVKRPGLKVRHRNGYVDSSQEERVADRAFSSLILDMESNPLGVTVDFATPQQEGINKYHLPLLVQVPFSQVTLLPDGDKMKGKLRLFFAVQDPDGAISQVQEVPYPVEITAAEMEQVKDKGLGYAVKLAVREGTPKIAVSVWDEISGTESYLLRNVPVGKSAEKKAAKSKPAR